MSYNMTSARERDLEGLLNDARCKIEELEEKIEDIQREIDDDLEYALLKFARDNECYFCINMDGMVYIAKGEDTITITPDGKVLTDDIEHITQEKMWKILNSWKQD